MKTRRTKKTKSKKRKSTKRKVAKRLSRSRYIGRRAEKRRRRWSGTARDVRTHKRGHFHTCCNRDIRNAINVTSDPTQRKEAVAFLKKCHRQIKPGMVGRRGGISRGNYQYLLDKIGKKSSARRFVYSALKKHTRRGRIPNWLYAVT